MANPHIDIPVRAPAATSADDTVLPFEVAALDLRGRVVRLGSMVDEILARHDYPLPVAKLLGEAIALTVLLGSALKFEGRFILQTQTDGPVRMLIVDFRSPGKVRACARFDAARVAAAIEAGKAGVGALLGHGHLAMTIDQGADMSRYQGLVALKAAAWRTRRTNISRAPSRFRPGCGSPWRRNCRPARATAGGPAACCCSSCPSRRSAPASPTCIPATRRRAPRSTRCRRTTPGSKAAR